MLENGEQLWVTSGSVIRDRLFGGSLSTEPSRKVPLGRVRGEGEESAVSSVYGGWCVAPELWNQSLGSDE